MAVALDTRTRILDATIDLLASGGDSAVRLALVAEALEISEPSIYHHFKNRSELITGRIASGIGAVSNSKCRWTTS